jgi:hypothetical protein
LRRRGRTIRPLLVRDFCPAAYISLGVALRRLPIDLPQLAEKLVDDLPFPLVLRSAHCDCRKELASQEADPVKTDHKLPGHDERTHLRAERLSTASRHWARHHPRPRARPPPKNFDRRTPDGLDRHPKSAPQVYVARDGGRVALRAKSTITRSRRIPTDVCYDFTMVQFFSE